MTNICFVVLLLFNIIYNAKAVVKTEQNLPKPFADCKGLEYELRHHCIMGIYNKGTDWIESKDDAMQLRLQQDFYWHPTKRVRRECRTLTKEERQEMWDAVNALKQDKSKEPNLYDWFADLHTKRVVYSVHFGPNFFGWHRFYTLRFEELLRKVNPKIALCYWDSTIDHNMEVPPLTVMFTEKFFGNPWGNVRTGPYANWKTIRGVPLKRDLGKNGDFMTPKQIEKVLSRERHYDISEPTAEEKYLLEAFHNNIHTALGGQMDNFNTSAQEPVFWFHHAFVDSIWEKFCSKMRSKGKDPQDDYVTKWVSSMQQPDKFMDRFTPLKNIDGYSNYFTKNIYEYEDYPTCANKCWESVFMKCTTPRCTSLSKFDKIKEKSGLPRKYNNELSNPLSDFKILSGEQTNWVFVPIKIIFRNPLHKNFTEKPIVGCDDADKKSDRCKKAVAIVQTKGVTYKGNYIDYINCDISIPVWTYAFIAIKSPEKGTSESFVSVTKKDGKPCMPLCLSKDEDKYEMCNGVINASSADPQIYTNTLEDGVKAGYHFDPISPDEMDKRVKLEFVCY